MSLHFLIDGYNAIMQFDLLKDINNLEHARMSLVNIIQAKRLPGGKDSRVTVVFDSKIKYDLCLAQNKGAIKIIFAKDESADEVIKRMVDYSEKPEQMMIVSNDREIIFFTRSLGAKTMSVKEFFSKELKQSQLPRKQREQKKGTLKATLPFQQQETINQELRKLWKFEKN